MTEDSSFTDTTSKYKEFLLEQALRKCERKQKLYEYREIDEG